MQVPAANHQLLLGRYQIEGVLLYAHPIQRAMNRQLRMPSQQLVHQALEIWRQMLDHDKGESAVVRHVVKELLQRLEPAGRCRHSHNVTRSVRRRRRYLIRALRPCHLLRIQMKMTATNRTRKVSFVSPIEAAIHKDPRIHCLPRCERPTPFNLVLGFSFLPKRSCRTQRSPS